MKLTLEIAFIMSYYFKIERFKFYTAKVNVSIVGFGFDEGGKNLVSMRVPPKLDMWPTF